MVNSRKHNKMYQELFATALHIEKPFYVETLEFDEASKRLDIRINFERGTHFADASSTDSDQKYPVHDTVEKKWRHLNFFEHECYLTARVPRIKLSNGKVRQVKMAWEGIAPGFTLLFEALLIELCRNMPVRSVERLTGVSDDKLWRILHCYIDLAISEADLSALEEIGIDETSMRKNHNYISLFVDLASNKLIHVSEGKSAETVEDFAQELPRHNTTPEQVKEVSCDMSPAFIKGVKEHLPEAQITFDKFHIIKILNSAVDKVRNEEVKLNEILKNTKYIFLKNKENLTPKQQVKLKELNLSKINLKSIRAMNIRDSFQQIYQADNSLEFELLLKKWYFWATHSKIEHIQKAAKTIKEHWDGVIRWFETKISNGVLEGLNSIVQAAKAKARGYKTFQNFKAIAFLLAGDLDFSKFNKHTF